MVTNGEPHTAPSLICAGTFSKSRCAPLACSLLWMMPASSLAPSTTAPAPSPNSTQVARSFQSKMRLKISAPMTSAFFAMPLLIYALAVVMAYIKPAHTACTSNAGQPSMPNLCCTMVAVAGNCISGVAVATIIKSISCAGTLASSNAFKAACTAKSLVFSLSAAKWRALMPVRVVIHSSDVSIRFAKSSLLTRLAGR